jgi:RNA polymerase sigma-70 factor (sigma-E family)
MQPVAAPACSIGVASEIGGVELAKASQREVMRAAFEQHYVPLLRLGIALSGRLETAEDLVQEAFVRAAPHLEQLGPPDVHPYLRRIVLNLWKNRLRRFALEARTRMSTKRDSFTDPIVEERDSLWRALMQLPSRQRACVVLRFYEDLSELEVSRVLGCSVGTVKSQTSRGLAKLRKAVSQ